MVGGDGQRGAGPGAPALEQVGDGGTVRTLAGREPGREVGMADHAEPKLRQQQRRLPRRSGSGRHGQHVDSLACPSSAPPNVTPAPAPVRRHGALPFMEVNAHVTDVRSLTAG